MIKIKKQMYVASLVIVALFLVLGVTYAFFNYTRTGSGNSVGTGRMSFASSQSSGAGDAISLDNAFPISSSQAQTDTVNAKTLSIAIRGDTDYSEGMEYLVTATDVHNTVGSGNNQKTIPITLEVSVANNGTGTLGTEETGDYYKNRNSYTTSKYSVEFDEDLEEDGHILVGYIAPNTTPGTIEGVDGIINIKAYFDSSRVLVSDTYPEGSVEIDGVTYYNGTQATELTVLTLDEWNSLKGNNAISFKIKVEANKGIWVEEVNTTNAMTLLPSSVFNYTLKDKIREIYMNKMKKSEIKTRYEAATIKGDVTDNSEGSVKYWLEPDEVDNTKYIMYIASNGKTYLPENCNNMFSYYSNLEKIEFNNVDTSRTTNMSQLLRNNPKLESIDLSSFNMENVTDMSSMLRYNTSLTSVDLSNKGGDNLTKVTYIVANCSNIKTLNFHNFNFGQVNSLNQWLDSMQSLESIDLSGAKMPKVTSFSNMFWANHNLTSVNFQGVVTPKLTGISGMFRSCDSLTSIDLSGLGSDVLSDASQMFNGCTNLTEVIMDNFNFGVINSTASPFYEASYIESVSLSNVNTSRMTNMGYMFYNCSSLTSLDLSSFNTSLVTNMYSMFYGCSELTSIDLSSFNTSAVTSMAQMFYGNAKLEEIFVSNYWTTNSATSSYDMFKNCTSLVGESNTHFDSNYIDKTYAHIDGGQSNPGYLTYKAYPSS